MAARYHTAPGEVTTVSSLRVSKARELAGFLSEGLHQYATLVECRVLPDAEVVVFEVEVELPQIRIHPIERFERIAVIFSERDIQVPETLALREDFPLVPHLNLHAQEFPRSLCLYEERYREIKREWTAARYVERVRTWLGLTAKGNLHGDDQPLEPLLLGQDGHIVLPSDLFGSGAESESERLFVRATKITDQECFLIADRAESNTPHVSGLPFVASLHLCQPQQHGVIRQRPKNLKELCDFVANAGLDIRSSLASRLKKWKEQAGKESKNLLDSRLVLIVVFPKTREVQSAVEATEIRCFLTAKTVRELGEDLGIWELRDGQLGFLLGGPRQDAGAEVGLLLLSPVLRLSRQATATLNGIEKNEDPRITAIGVGALGSQVTMNLARCGYGTWTLIDGDDFLPHNGARHALAGDAIGFPKAKVVALLANSLTDNEEAMTAIVADVMEPGARKEEVAKALTDAEVILDMSASVAVARYLARDIDARARRISAFLNPSGEDLVILAEDRERSTSLDALEMQYYQAVASSNNLVGHFKPQHGRWRYGQSCRDLTSHIPHELVALHAAIASRAFREIVADKSAKILIWRADQQMGVQRVVIDVRDPIRVRVGEWELVSNDYVLQRLAELRNAKLPNETGGVLVGSLDLERKIAYIIDTVPSPPDSEEWPTVYIRGCRGLRRQVDELAARSDGMIQYLGEWHSHPDGSRTQPSPDDGLVFTWLADLMEHDGLPALMLIVGGSEVTFIVEKVDYYQTIPMVARS